MAQWADRYALEQVIRDDGAGSIHAASDRERGDKVRVHRAGEGALPEARERLAALIEARVVQRASSPALVRLRDGGVDEESGDPYLVAQEIEGTDLEARLAEGPPLTVEAALRLVIDLLGGLGALHRHDLGHGDVCPRNVLLVERPGGVSPRLDGLGVNAAPFRAARAPWPDHVELSSLAYASPEQASREELASPASDVYSAAAMLYAMLGGRAPHAGEDERSLRREVAAGVVPSLGDDPVFADSPLAALLDQALHPDRGERIDRAERLQQELRKALLGLGSLRGQELPVGPRVALPAATPAPTEGDGFFSADDWADAAPDSIAPPAPPEAPEPVEEEPAAEEAEPPPEAPAARRLYAPVDPSEFDDDEDEEEESTRVGVVSEALLLQTMRELDEAEGDEDEDEDEPDEPTRARVVAPEMLDLLEAEDDADGEPSLEAPSDEARSVEARSDEAPSVGALAEAAPEPSPSTRPKPRPSVRPVGALPPPDAESPSGPSSLAPPARRRGRAALTLVAALALGVLAAAVWFLLNPPT